MTDAGSAVREARARARRRLIGAAVLLGIGIIGFPLLFETQPRPIAVDIPIEIPHRDQVPPLAAAPAASVASLPPAAASQAALAASGPAASAPVAVVAEPLRATLPPAPPASVPAPARASAPVAAASKPAPPAPVAASRPAAPASVARTEAPAKPASAIVHAPRDRPAASPTPPSPPPPSPPPTAAPRAGATLPPPVDTTPGTEPPPVAPTAERYVVQIGAFSDAALAHQARLKVERLGLKTYTQTVDTPDGKRTRVRVGPFQRRQDADAVAAKVRGGGVTAAVLTL